MAEFPRVLGHSDARGAARQLSPVTAFGRNATETTMYAEDGLHFSKTHKVIDVPHAAGAYCPEAFTDSRTGERIQWGVHIGKQKGSLPFIQRFDLVEAE